MLAVLLYQSDDEVSSRSDFTFDFYWCIVEIHVMYTRSECQRKKQ